MGGRRKAKAKKCSLEVNQKKYVMSGEAKEDKNLPSWNPSFVFRRDKDPTLSLFSHILSAFYSPPHTKKVRRGREAT